MSEFLYLQTLQHTGTWFIIYFVCDHEEVGGFVLEDTTFKALNGFSERREESGRGETVWERAARDRKTLLVGHVACHSQQSPPYLCPRQQSLALVNPRPIVVPLRDPLLAMITHERRIENFKETRLYHKITTWRLYFKFLSSAERYKRVTYFPIDRLTNYDIRRAALSQLQAAYGLRPHSVARRWAENWKVYNSHVPQDDPNKQAYANGDVTYLERSIPHSLKALREAEDVLRPILERFYSDLLWWS